MGSSTRMPAGTPITLKCPACKRGKYGCLARKNGVRHTGRVEPKWTRSKHRGAGKGGSGFRGHRGEVECLDCGYKWFSTHPDSGRISCFGPNACPAHS